MTGAQLALRKLEDAFKHPKAKCPFVPQREMVKKALGHGRRPAGSQGRLGKTPGQGQQAVAVPALTFERKMTRGKFFGCFMFKI